MVQGEMKGIFHVRIVLLLIYNQINLRKVLSVFYAVHLCVNPFLKDLCKCT